MKEGEWHTGPGNPPISEDEARAMGILPGWMMAYFNSRDELELGVYTHLDIVMQTVQLTDENRALLFECEHIWRTIEIERHALGIRIELSKTGLRRIVRLRERMRPGQAVGK